MVEGFPIITLCGSTRFFEDFRIANLKLTLQGWRVFSIGIDTKSDRQVEEAGSTKIDKVFLDSLHKAKIRDSQAIMIIDGRIEGHPNGYIGESTRSEILYALRHAKPMYSYSETVMNFPNFEELIPVKPQFYGIRDSEKWMGACIHCGADPFEHPNPFCDVLPETVRETLVCRIPHNNPNEVHGTIT